MKRYGLVSLLLAGMFACPAVCREFEREDAEFDIGMREKQMELEHRQAEMDTEREMQKLQLDERRLDLERARHGHKNEAQPLLLLLAVVHILLAVWVYMDIRQLNRGSGIWIVLTLLAGLFTALIYAIVRLGDNRQGKS